MIQLILKKILCIYFIILLLSCTSNTSYKHQCNGSHHYLKVSPLRSLSSPSDTILPHPTDDYKIPPLVAHNSKIGKSLDIRPPT
ncbi:outer membrane protein assembly factor BamC [Candidatus Curculioniphilus buchneri]|uniref:outer membrane protein assembly factor BamC n=1 Tax=Candidatus Curculioniphilus buchneri TaxID=690594 RepID=UPI00376F325B